MQCLGYFDSLQQRGIGGIEKPDRIRCLHTTWYAAHLVAPNTVGELVDAHWLESERTESPLTRTSRGP